MKKISSSSEIVKHLFQPFRYHTQYLILIPALLLYQLQKKAFLINFLNRIKKIVLIFLEHSKTVIIRFSLIVFFFQAEDGIRDRSPSRGLGDVYKRQYSYIIFFAETLLLFI